MQIIITTERRSAYICFNVATNCQGLAYKASNDWEIKHHCTTGIIFVAFSIEAMLNHFGKVMFKDKWESRRKCRKEQHKMLFEAVNLHNYLGNKTYQVAIECFKIRDIFAHGKTENEDLKVTVKPNTSHEELVLKMVSEPSLIEREVTIEKLDKYIDIARKIEEDIQEYGYYPHQDDIPLEQKEKLLECPLEVMGIREF